MWWIAIPIGYSLVGFFAYCLSRSAKTPMPRPEDHHRAR